MSKCVAAEGISQSQFKFGELIGNWATWFVFLATHLLPYN